MNLLRRIINAPLLIVLQAKRARQIIRVSETERALKLYHSMPGAEWQKLQADTLASLEANLEALGDLDMRMEKLCQ